MFVVAFNQLDNACNEAAVCCQLPFYSV